MAQNPPKRIIYITRPQAGGSQIVIRGPNAFNQAGVQPVIIRAASQIQLTHSAPTAIVRPAPPPPVPQAPPPKVTSFGVVIPPKTNKHFHLMKFNTAAPVDMAKWTKATLYREDHQSEYQADWEKMPKFGAGSEYGREAREVARAKKLGFNRREYKAEDQPWVLTRKQADDTRSYRGVKEGTVQDNSSYYIFHRVTTDKFEAYPVESWFNFTAMNKHRTLNIDEAEEEFSRRDKTLNKFNVMLRRKMRPDEEGTSAEVQKEEGAKPGKKKESKQLKLTDLEDWVGESDENESSEFEEVSDEEKKEKGSKKKGKEEKKKIVKKKKPKGEDDEDEDLDEDSDDGDHEGDELDYSSDVSSSASDQNVEGSKYNNRGVDQERGLHISDESESEEAEEQNNEEQEDPEVSDKPSTVNLPTELSDSESSSSDSDDPDKDESIGSGLFSPTREKPPKIEEFEDAPSTSTPATTSAPSTSTPPPPATIVSKRKADEPETAAKKPKLESRPVHGSSAGNDVIEVAVRRYLARKPMTPKELVLKLKSKVKDISKEDLVNKVAMVLKKINPDKKTIKGNLYLSLKSEK